MTDAATILIAEDEIMIALGLELILRENGYRILHVDSGPDVVKAVERYHPELALIDIKMPGEYNGVEAARRVMTKYTTKVIFWSGFDITPYRPCLRGFDDWDFIEKTANYSTILQAVRKKLGALQDYAGTQQGKL